MSRPEAVARGGGEVDAELIFGRYNFHLPRTVEAVHDRLASELPGKVVILSGPEGSGRRYVWSAALYQLADDGIRWREVDLDLEGFEEDVASHERFISLLLENAMPDRAEPNLASAAHAVAQAMVNVPGPVGATAAGVRTLLGLGRPLREIAARLLASSSERRRLPALPEASWLGRLLDEMTRDAPLAIYCAKPHHLTPGLRRTLKQALDGNARLALAMAALDVDSSDSLWPHATVPPARVAVAPLSQREITAVFARRFEPNRCPHAFVDALWSSSGGRAGEIAARVGDLVARNVLEPDEYGCWRIAPGTLADAAVAGSFEHDLLRPLYALGEHLDAEVWQDLTRFLGLAAACGDFVPASAVLGFLDLGAEREERLVDVIDERLVCPPASQRTPFRNLASPQLCPIFDDLQFGHPGFPKQLVYKFRSSIHRRVLARQRAFAGPDMISAFRASLEQNLPRRSRAAAEVHLSVATALGDGERRGAERQLLSWWAGWNEAEALEEAIVLDLEHRTVEPGVIWSAVQRFSLLWPPYRMLALINAYRRQPDGPPVSHLASFHLTRALTLLNLGRFGAALDDARLALSFHEQSGEEGARAHADVLLVATLHCLGVCLFAVGKHSEARGLFERVVAEAADGSVGDHDLIGKSLHQIGSCLFRDGRYDEARGWYERAIDKLRQSTASRRVDHQVLGESLHQVGRCLVGIGDYDRARGWFERAIDEKMEGDLFGRVNHDSLGRSVHQVGICLSRTGQFEDARPWFERAAGEKAKGDVFGRTADSVGASFHEVGICILGMGKPDEARGWFERAVAEISKGDAFGRVDHDTLGKSVHLVGACLASAEKWDEARSWLERAIADLAEGDLFKRVNHDAVGRSMEKIGECLLATGKHDEARGWFERAVGEQAQGDLFGRVDHARLAASLYQVGLCLEISGREEEARSWCERAAATLAEAM